MERNANAQIAGITFRKCTIFVTTTLHHPLKSFINSFDRFFWWSTENKFRWNEHCVKSAVFRVFLVRVFSHLDQKTPNTDTFHTVETRWMTFTFYHTWYFCCIYGGRYCISVTENILIKNIFFLSFQLH